MALRLLLPILLLLQIGFALYTKRFLPELGIVPALPTQAEIHVQAMGDPEFLFRRNALMLQQAGDTFGRSTALYRYDYPTLKSWFLLMDGLNNRSNFIPTLASYYFAQSQNSNDVSYIVDYLQAHTQGRVASQWWWVMQAAYLAKYRLKDDARALSIADPLAHATEAPLWVQQYPAFLYEQAGEFDHALHIIETIVQNAPDISEKELSFMQFFVKERLKKLEDAEKLFPKP